ncbi:hypothetical protein H6G76_28350 [Nostoc sp. FACHB-152]|uniref:hypothetical protein n=1 Tax=unclassified Nostoc TaxID=2593658 RepID=UPI0016892C10|nr:MULTISPECIES: hypothetical protein [unclassified Nostoc]MBD2450971.1 hypothetical protein [Nostoc sp. FACHB-152]MBD2470016.1 hypothetical protein [Nostoc sp. FACHB-145]
MNTPIFDNHYVTCPICQRNTKPKPIKAYMGLFTCPYCQEKLVVCRSGHYVRDPFTLKQIMLCASLRRQSSPFARIARDFLPFKGPLIALAVGSAVLFSMMSITQQNTNHDEPPLPKTEKIHENTKN